MRLTIYESLPVSEKPFGEAVIKAILAEELGSMECVLGLKRGVDLEIVSFGHGMSPVQGAAKSLAVKWLYFWPLKS